MMLVAEVEFKDFNILDIGNSLEITGVLYGNDIDRSVLILLPDSSLAGDYFEIMVPGEGEWKDIVRQSDIKEVELLNGSKDKKIVLRKSTRNIETNIMWEVFRRDEFTCRYCANDKVPLTVDHIVLWEEGGPTIPMNLITSCKKCNNRRGSMDYKKWLHDPYYQSNVPKLSTRVATMNSKAIEDIPIIRKSYMRKNKRSR